MENVLEIFKCEPISPNHNLKLDGFFQRHGHEIDWLNKFTIGIFVDLSPDYLTEIMVELRRTIINDDKNLILSIGAGMTREPLQTAAHFSNTAVIALDGDKLFSDNMRGIPDWMVQEIVDNKSLAIGFRTYTSELKKTLRKHLKFPKVHIFCPVPMSQQERVVQAIDFLESGGELILVCDPRSQFEEFYPSNVRYKYDENNPTNIYRQLKNNTGLTEVELLQLTMEEVEQMTGADDSKYLEPKELKYLQKTYKTEKIPVITFKRV